MKRTCCPAGSISNTDRHIFSDMPAEASMVSRQGRRLTIYVRQAQTLFFYPGGLFEKACSRTSAIHTTRQINAAWAANDCSRSCQADDGVKGTAYGTFWPTCGPKPYKSSLSCRIKYLNSGKTQQAGHFGRFLHIAFVEKDSRINFPLNSL